MELVLYAHTAVLTAMQQEEEEREGKNVYLIQKYMYAY